MNKAMREHLARMLEAMPNGATNSSLSWTDDEVNYYLCVSATLSSTGENWQITASMYKIIPPMQVAEQAIPLPKAELITAKNF